MSTILDIDGQPADKTMARINQMFSLSAQMMSIAKDGGIECCVIFFHHDDIQRTLRAGAQMSVGGILEAINMMCQRAGISGDRMTAIREQLAGWAEERVMGAKAADDAANAASASDLLDVAKGVKYDD